MQNLLRSILLMFVFSLAGLSVQAQQHSKQDIKMIVSRLYYFTRNLVWEDFNDATFNVGYFVEDKDLEPELRKLKRSKKIQGKELALFEFNSIDELTGANLHALYLNPKRTRKLGEILEATKGQQCLILSDHSKEKNKVMINFFDWNNTLGFEIHKANVSKRRITVKPNLVLIGGKEVDVRQLYLESSKSLKTEKEKVEQQRRLIAKQKKEMLEQKALLEDQTKSINMQQAQIVEQNEELEKQQARMRIQRAELDTLMVAIAAQQSAFEQKQQEVIAKENEVAEQQKNVERYNSILAGLRSNIEVNQNQIAKQKSNLKEKELVISSQSERIIYILVGLGVAVALIVLALLAYIAKRRANQLLVEKNETIKKQNVEIQQRNEEVMAQRDELAKVNTEIQQQKEEIESQKDELMRQKDIVENQHSMITGSIRYAQTIQSAILPPAATVAKSFDNFVLFRPKDIVSGDFYWHSRTERNGGVDSYFAIVDCTGHGVPGAFMSMIGSRLLNLLVNERELTDPAEILEHLDRGVIQSLRQDQNENRDGMEVCLIRVFEKDGVKQIEFSGARRPLFLYQHSCGELIKFVGCTRGIAGPLKKSKRIAFSTAKITAEPNDVMYLTTDGLKDQNDVARKRFGSPALMNLIQSIGHLPMKEQHKAVEEVLDNHMQGVDQRDDITMAGVKV